MFARAAYTMKRSAQRCIKPLEKSVSGDSNQLHCWNDEKEKKLYKWNFLFVSEM